MGATKWLALMWALVLLAGCGSREAALTDDQIRDIVERSWPYVAVYNVSGKFVSNPESTVFTGGWNRMSAHTAVMDHTFKSIRRPNNDILYAVAMLDLTHEPMILEIPAFDTDYASLMVTGYDNYVNIPLSTRHGDFDRRTRIMFHSQRSPGYDGTPIQRVDEYFETSGDYITAILRVIPHANDPQRYGKNLKAIDRVKVKYMSECMTGVAPPPRNPAEFPAYGTTDEDIFGTNLLEVMQFVFNHSTFDPDHEPDQELLALYEPLGVVPGREFDPDEVALIDNERFREIAEEVAAGARAKIVDQEYVAANLPSLYLPKGEMDQELVTTLAIVGPAGLPAAEVVYPQITTDDGSPFNAQNDYVVRMSADELPPAEAYWSITLYDAHDGYFIPNERYKYTVSESAGMMLGRDGGLEIHIAAGRPEGVPEVNWLPIPREDLELSMMIRMYHPDLARFAEWQPPKAVRVQ